MENFKKTIFVITIILSGVLFSKLHADFAFYPFGAYTSETSVMLGSYASYEWIDPSLPANVRHSNLETNVIVSFKKQLSIYFGNRKVLKDNRFSLGVPFRYRNWPSTFYGVYLQNEPDLEEDYTPEAFEVNPFMDFRVTEKMIIKPAWSFKNFRIAKEDNENPLLSSYVTGYEDYQLSGPEFTLKLLTTDSYFYPTKGCSLKIDLKYYHEELGSDYDFSYYSADYRRYFSTGKTNIIAGQLLWKSIDGIAPFSELVDLGEDMRGYNELKHINNNMGLFRIEDRIFPFKNSLTRYGIVFFAESGIVYSDYDELNMNNLKLSYGMGFRYVLVPGQKLNLRVDVAFSKENVEVDIISFEAF